MKVVEKRRESRAFELICLIVTTALFFWLQKYENRQFRRDLAQASATGSYEVTQPEGRSPASTDEEAPQAFFSAD